MNDKLPALMIRVKVVNMDRVCRTADATVKTIESHKSAKTGSIADRAQFPKILSTGSESHAEPKVSEICIDTGNSVAHADFENHIETCRACANRVELQLDFIETLEASLYQRHSAAEYSKVAGALLVSAPDMNFAICGDLEA